MAESNVVTLKGDPMFAGEPNPELVKHLEDWLEMAKAGEIISGGVAVLYRDGAVGRSLAANGKSSGMVGELFSLMRDVAR